MDIRARPVPGAQAPGWQRKPAEAGSGVRRPEPPLWYGAASAAPVWFRTVVRTRDEWRHHEQGPDWVARRIPRRGLCPGLKPPGW